MSIANFRRHNLQVIQITSSNLVLRVSHLTAPWSERRGGGKMRDPGSEVELVLHRELRAMH